MKNEKQYFKNIETAGKKYDAAIQTFHKLIDKREIGSEASEAAYQAAKVAVHEANAAYIAALKDF